MDLQVEELVKPFESLMNDNDNEPGSEFISRV